MMPRALREAMRDSIPWWWRSKVWKKGSKVLVAAGGKRVQGPYLGKLSTPMHAAAVYNGRSYIKKTISWGTPLPQRSGSQGDGPPGKT